jgi:hypothetical protein
MGLETAIIMGVITAGIMIASMYAIKPAGDDMKPLGLDSFGVTQSNEGTVVPVIWGTVRTNSNLLWYGDLETKAVYAKAGGKGMPTPKMKQGYEYYIDMWHSLCLGPNVTIESAYLEDKEVTLASLGTYSFNDGSAGTYPTTPGAYASPLTPVAHIYFDRYFLGVNTTMVPTIHFILKRTSSCPLTYSNETNGVNPAAIIYDLLTEQAGVPVSSIDTTSFQDASDYWHDKGYALNIKLTSQEEVRDHINNIFTYVDAALRVDENDEFVLKAFKDSDTGATTITTDEFRSFRFTRRSWDDVDSDFRANYIDEDADYSQRTLRVRNPAVRNLVGHDKQASIDLTAFRDKDTASKRLWELMKKMSYPDAQITADVGIKYAQYNVGDVLSITHSDYEMTAVDFRIVSKEEGDIESNTITLEFVQVLESLMDSNYGAAGGTSWVQTHYSAEPVVKQRVLELPYTETYGEAPAFLCLAQREGQETGFSIIWSVGGTNYSMYDDATDFAQFGTLGENYSSSTYAIDDETGILYTPYRDDPTFDDVDRTELFSEPRVAILVTVSDPTQFEIVAFQTATPVGTSYRLTGVIRGLLNTPVLAHDKTDCEIWLSRWGDNVITGITRAAYALLAAVPELII